LRWPSPDRSFIDRGPEMHAEANVKDTGDSAPTVGRGDLFKQFAALVAMRAMSTKISEHGPHGPGSCQ